MKSVARSSKYVMTSVPLHGDALPVEDSVLDRARTGDHDAFTALVRHYDPGLRALAHRLLGDRDRMDDALQEAYLRAFRAISQFRGEAAFGTWLYRIAYNVCLQELARSQRIRAVPLESAEPSGQQADVGETVLLRSGLAEALAALPADERAAVLLVDAHGFDYRTAGEVLGAPEGTIASRLNRARASLRRALDEQSKGVHEDE
jgi:RNA polymerase sigma-70 factor (ECF subfamily)